MKEKIIAIISIIIISYLANFLFCSLIVKLASMIFGFKFSWIISVFVALVATLLKGIFGRGSEG